MTVAALLMAGCSQLGHFNDGLQAGASTSRSSNYQTPAPEPVPSSLPAGSVDQALARQYQSWRGTPYREGGASRKGIDCSAFVQNTFAHQLGMRVPRTTEKLARIGREIPREALKPGDLVFFRTGLKTRHVGIYMGNGYFMHASTSQGVIKSSLNNRYWSDSFWMGRQVLSH